MRCMDRKYREKWSVTHSASPLHVSRHFVTSDISKANHKTCYRISNTRGLKGIRHMVFLAFLITKHQPFRKKSSNYVCSIISCCKPQWQYFGVDNYFLGKNIGKIWLTNRKESPPIFSSQPIQQMFGPFHRQLIYIFPSREPIHL